MVIYDAPLEAPSFGDSIMTGFLHREVLKASLTCGMGTSDGQLSGTACIIGRPPVNTYSATLILCSYIPAGGTTDKRVYSWDYLVRISDAAINVKMAIPII